MSSLQLEPFHHHSILDNSTPCTSEAQSQIINICIVACLSWFLLYLFELMYMLFFVFLEQPQCEKQVVRWPKCQQTSCWTCKTHLTGSCCLGRGPAFNCRCGLHPLTIVNFPLWSTYLSIYSCLFPPSSTNSTQPNPHTPGWHKRDIIGTYPRGLLVFSSPKATSAK